MVDVEVVYIPKQGAIFHQRLSLPLGATAEDALKASTLKEQFPETLTCPIGIFSKPVTCDTLLQPGDRLEVYRPLEIDPKEKRRLRAKKG